MASYTYEQFRTVLRRLNFEKVRSEKHGTWRKVLPDETILRARISHKHGNDIPKWLFHEMLRQTGINKKEFERILKEE